jgi:hypothetical protein
MKWSINQIQTEHDIIEACFARHEAPTVVVVVVLVLVLLKIQVFPECYTVSLDKLTPMLQRIILLHLRGQAVPTCQAFGDL